jgi:hypothetical protein
MKSPRSTTTLTGWELDQLAIGGVKSNRAALGTAVTLEQGADKYTKEVRSGDGFFSQSDPRLHFRLGKATKAEKIVIRWISGVSRRFRIFLRTTTTWFAKAAAWTQVKLMVPVLCGLVRRAGKRNKQTGPQRLA